MDAFFFFTRKHRAVAFSGGRTRSLLVLFVYALRALLVELLFQKRCSRGPPFLFFFRERRAVRDRFTFTTGEFFPMRCGAPPPLAATDSSLREPVPLSTAGNNPPFLFAGVGVSATYWDSLLCLLF